MYKVLLFYKFINIESPEELRDQQKALCDRLGLTGRMIIAHEGINGTFEGTAEAVEKYKQELIKDSRFADIVFKESEGNGWAFPKAKIKVRDEIVTLNAGEFDNATERANEITAEELHSLYESDEDFVVLDLRNDYEIKVGAFEKTYDPGLQNFRDLSEKLDDIKELHGKKIVTVCTGGIRCDKATCLMKKRGFENIYQLKDGIHNYMEKYPGGHFKGSLFVFDNRMITDVVEVDNKEVIGRCVYCNNLSEQYYSDDSFRPSRKVICCDNCYQAHKDTLRTVLPEKAEQKV